MVLLWRRWFPNGLALRSYLILVLLPLVSVPLLTVGWIAAEQVTRTATQHAFNTVRQLLRDTRGEVSARLATVGANAALFAGNPLLKDYLATEDEESRYGILQLPLLHLFASYAKVYPDYYEMRVLLPDGTEEARHAAGGLPNRAEREGETPWFNRFAAVHRTVVFTELFRNPDNGEWAFLVARKVFGRGASQDPTEPETWRGGVAITTRPDFLRDRIHATRIGAGGFLLVVNEAGEVVFAPDWAELPFGMLSPALWTRLAAGSQEEEPGLEPLRVEWSGGEALVMGIRLPQGLRLFAVTRAEEFAATARPMGLAVAAVMLVSALLVLVLVQAALKRIVFDPLVKLSGAVRDVGAGALDRRVDLGWVREFAFLAESFNVMVEDLRRSREQIRQQSEQLERDRVKGEFLARMSHEIRTPLNAIIGLGDLVRQTALDARQRDYLVRMEGASRQLLGIINDILDYSRIEAGGLTLEVVPVSLDEVLQRVIDLINVAAMEKRLEWWVDRPIDFPEGLRGDPLRLAQILINLLGNAVKFTERGGEVILGVSVVREERASVRMRFSVRDTGIGMTQEQCARLFHPFSQADGSITRQYGGTGLGLAISKRLVERMDGGIRVVSAPGVGSEFICELTLARDSATAVGRSRKRDALIGEGVMILASRSAPRRFLARMGMELGLTVRVFAASQTALASFGAEPCAWVILDVEREERVWLIGALRGRVPGVRILAPVPLDPEEERPSGGVDVWLDRPILPQTLRVALLGGAAARADSSRERIATERRHVGVRLLLVEDNPLNQMVAREILADFGLTVEIAGNGAEAVARVAREDFDGVLMDLQMPVMDGLTATRRIRALTGRAATLPIVAMTAQAMPGDRDRCLEAGMNDYLSKPIERRALAAVLSKWFPARSGAVGVAEPSEAESRPDGSAEVATDRAVDGSAAADRAADGSAGAVEADPFPEGVEGVDLEDALERLGGRRVMLRRFLESFCRDHGDDAARLRALLAGSGPAGLVEAGALLHGIKGMAGNLGAHGIRGLAGELEETVKAGETPSDEALARFEAACARLCRAVAVLPAIGEEVASGPVGSSGAHGPEGTVLEWIEALRERLGRNDLDAERCLKGLASVLPVESGGGREAVRAIEACVDRYDFAGAIREVEDLAGRLGATGSGRECETA
ncbi:MAG: response regulator [Magnetococcales bacterium]|nr:response regulator [Magnetococcales bacterium]